jgi:ActR/RegA family two-component response regulator
LKSALNALPELAAMDEPVLFVDDEPHLLEGVARALHKRFDVHTAASGEEGLRVLEAAGPFAVVVSDMRMPTMDGVQFLAKARDLCPETVRFILSGQSDLAATIAAVNEGNIFRFLNKPCPAQVLSAAIGTGVEQYRLILAEKVLLEQTLSGAVNMLIEMLGAVNPAASGRARRLQHYVMALVGKLGLRAHWQWPLAALVSQLGCAALPKDTLSKVEAGEPLSEEEQCLYDSHPRIAGEMLAAIPRLEDVALIVAGQNDSLCPLGASEEPAQWNACAAGRILLRAAMEFDRAMLRGITPTALLAVLRTAGTGLPQAAISALRDLPAAGCSRVMRHLRFRDLSAGMLLDEALVTTKGACLVPAGQEVTANLLLRLRSIAANVQLREPFRVQVPV